jgi:hypothetical protein
VLLMLSSSPASCRPLLALSCICSAESCWRLSVDVLLLVAVSSVSWSGSQQSGDLHIGVQANRAVCMRIRPSSSGRRLRRAGPLLLAIQTPLQGSSTRLVPVINLQVCNCMKTYP